MLWILPSLSPVAFSFITLPPYFSLFLYIYIVYVYTHFQYDENFINNFVCMCPLLWWVDHLYLPLHLIQCTEVSREDTNMSWIKIAMDRKKIRTSYRIYIHIHTLLKHIRKHLVEHHYTHTEIYIYIEI